MLIEKIKADQLEARKARDTVAATLLSTLLGEASSVSEEEFKAAAAKTPEGETVVVPITDEKVTATVTKFLKGAKQTAELLEAEFTRVLGHSSSDGKTYLMKDGDREFMEGIVPKMRATDREIAILSGYLPKQMTNYELADAINAFKAANPDANMGAIMAHLKANFAGLYDGKAASQIAKG